MKIIFNWIISIVIILLVIPGILVEALVLNKQSELIIKTDDLNKNITYGRIISILKEEILLGIILYLVIGLIVRGF